ncbi:MAG TPA: cation:proton antiporter [Actinobacteria bacterium]|nr:cation:proton antiporter [Actinomycetota bacterium]
MSEVEFGSALAEIALLLGIAFVVGSIFDRVRVPRILAALFVGMGAHLVLGAPDPSAPLGEILGLLGQLGVLWLLLLIGLEIDPREMSNMGGDIVLLTVFNTVVPFLFGFGFMLALGYGVFLSLFIGMTRMPTAEAVVVPILDEFGMVNTRVGRFVVGAGVLDDLVEVVLVVVASVWIGTTAAGTGGSLGTAIEHDVVDVVGGGAAFALVAYAAYRWILPFLATWTRGRPRELLLLSSVTLFALGGLAQLVGLGLVVGALVTGIVLRPTVDGGEPGRLGVRAAIDLGAYGFFGPLFFLWVGRSVDLAGMVEAPWLAIGLFSAAFFGKLLGAWLLVPFGRATREEALATGIGLNARLTTEIIVAQLLLGAGIIDDQIFTALVAASGLSTLLVPPLFAVVLDRWGPSLESAGAVAG